LPSAPAQGLVSPEVAGEQLADGLKKAAKGGVEANVKSLAAADPSGKVVAPDSKAIAANLRTADLQTAPLATAIATASLVQTFQREDQPRERSVFRSTANEGTAALQAVSSAFDSDGVNHVGSDRADGSLVAEQCLLITNNVKTRK
jgi:hypothetical protein